MFFGRTKDLKLLNEKWNSNRFEFGILYGTRRIGKTALVHKFMEGKKALYFQAKEASELENRRALSNLLNSRLQYPADYVFPSWDSLFDAVLKLSDKERFLFVIDEYPYLAKSKKNGICSYLQDFVDNKASDSRLFILLLGSNVSFMEKEVGNSRSPLFRRRTFSYQLEQMTFSESLLFLEDFPSAERLNYLSFFGFSPYYLSLLRSNFTFEENLKALLFNKGATLLDAPEIILSNGAREKGIYNTILLSVARGRKTPTEISNDIALTINEVSKYLKTLLDEEILEKKTMFNSKRKSIYGIKDPVLKFYYMHLLDEINRIQIGYGDIVYSEMQDKIQDFICREFEDICIHYMEEKSILGNLKYPYYPIQNLVIDNSELGRSIEIDGLSRYKDSLLVMECKYTNRKRTIKDYAWMKENISISMFKDIKDYQFYIFAKSGFESSLTAVAEIEENLHLIDSNVLLKG